VYHGPEETKLGFSLVTTVETPGFTLVHAPDVQGPMYRESLEYISGQEPDVLIIGGPPVYIRFKLDEEDISRAKKNLMELAKKVPKLVVDHHLLRTTDYKDFLAPIKKVAERAGNEVMTASELIGKETVLLEARRRELHEEEPVGDEWYESLGKGELQKSIKTD